MGEHDMNLLADMPVGGYIIEGSTRGGSLMPSTI